MHPQFPALGLRLRVNRVQLRTRTDADDARLDPFDGRKRGDIEQHATLEGHGLTVIAGPACADGDRHAMVRAGCGGADHITLIARRDDQVRRLAVEQFVQDRAVPEEVA